MKRVIQVLIFSTLSVQAFAQNSHAEEEILKLSKDKWQWMVDKNVNKLKDLFHDQPVFVHMGGSWDKARELEVIKSGGIHYKKPDKEELPDGPPGGKWKLGSLSFTRTMGPPAAQPRIKVYTLS